MRKFPKSNASLHRRETNERKHVVDAYEHVRAVLMPGMIAPVNQKRSKVCKDREREKESFNDGGKVL